MQRIFARRLPHYGLRKLSVGVVAALLGTTLFIGTNSTVAQASDQTENDSTNQLAVNISDQQEKVTQSPSAAVNESQSSLNSQNSSAMTVDSPKIVTLAKQEVPTEELGSVEFHNYVGLDTNISPIQYTRDSTTGKLKTIDLTSVAQQVAQNYSNNSGFALADVQVDFLNNNNQVIGNSFDPNTLTDAKDNTDIYIHAYDKKYDEGTANQKTQKQMNEHHITPTKSAQYIFMKSTDSGDIVNVSYLTPAEAMKVAGNEGTYENSINKDLPASYWQQQKNLGTITYKDDQENTVTKYLAANPNPDGNYSMYNQWLPLGNDGQPDASKVGEIINLISGGHKNYSFKSEEDFDNSALASLVEGNNGFTIYDSDTDLDEAYQDFQNNYPTTYETSFDIDFSNGSAVIYLPEYDPSGNVVAGKYAGAVFLYNSASDEQNPNKETINAVYKPLDKSYTGKLAPVYLYTAQGSTNGTAGFMKIYVDHDYGTSTVKRTIHYVYDNGTTAKPDHVDQLTFKSIDGHWDGLKDFSDVSTPEIAGYTSDRSVVFNKGISYDHANIVETVTYKAKTVPHVDLQALTYTIMDDTTGKTLAGPTTLSVGDSNSIVPASVTTAYDQIRQNWLDKGYTLDTTKAEGVGYDILPATYDNDDSTDQNVTIYLVHTYSPVNDQHPHAGVDLTEYEKDVKEIVHYKGAGAHTPADHVQTSKWTRTLTIDNVTGQLVIGGQYDTAWSIAKGNKSTYDQVDTPYVAGYATDQAYVPAFKVTMTDQKYLVVYHQQAKPVQPQEPETPARPEPPKQPGNPSGCFNKSTSQNPTMLSEMTNHPARLPQTGSVDTHTSGIIGLALVAGMMEFGLRGKRQD